MRLEGKTALITGGASGIGKAIGQRFAEEGAHVIIFDTQKPYHSGSYYRADITKEEQIQQAMNDVKKLDILVNNAGVYFEASVENTKKEDLDNVFAVNIKGMFLMCKHSLPLLKNSKGCIINIASSLGVVPDPLSAAYCSTKAGVIMLTRCLALEYASVGLRVKAILPGPLNTPMLRRHYPTEKQIEDYAKLNPMKRVGKPEEVANVALFLASEAAGYVTGGLYAVDGGESAASAYSL